MPSDKDGSDKDKTPGSSKDKDSVQGDPDLESFQSPYFTFAKVHFPTSLQA
jgi:hypothetical protein